MTVRLQQDVCQYHAGDHESLRDLKQVVKVVIDGQLEIREGLVQLTEAFKNMGRIERRLEKMEASRERQAERRDEEIKELRAFMNRSLGWAAAVLLTTGMILRVVGVA